MPLLTALLGLVSFSLGGGMMLRFFMGPDEVTLGHPELRESAERLYAVAGSELFAIYGFAMAFGFGAFCAGVAAMTARSRAPLVLCITGFTVSFFGLLILSYSMTGPVYMSDQAVPASIGTTARDGGGAYVVTIALGAAILAAGLAVLFRRASRISVHQ